MKLWILTLYRLASAAEKRVEALEKRIERIASNPFGATMRQYDKIVELGDLRIRIINAKVLIDQLVEKLTIDEKIVIGYYAHGLSAAAISEITGLRVGAVYTRLKHVEKKGKAVFIQNGYTEKRLENDYAEFAVLPPLSERILEFMPTQSKPPVTAKKPSKPTVIYRSKNA